MIHYSDSINVNCLGAVRMCHQFLPLLKQSKVGDVTPFDAVVFPNGNPEETQIKKRRNKLAINKCVTIETICDLSDSDELSSISHQYNVALQMTVDSCFTISR